MQIQFTNEEKQFTTLILKDAITGAKADKNRSVVRQGNRLLNKFKANATTSNIKLSELVLVNKIVNSAIIILEQILKEKNKKVDNDTTKKNLEFAKTYTTKLVDMINKQKEVLRNG